MTAADGKNYSTDAADVETLFRLVQSVPSPNAEPIKLWLAKVGHERLQETRMKPKFVYFDVGGVVVLDFSGTNKWEQLKKDLGIPENRYQEFDSFWDKYSERICLEQRVDTLTPEIVKKFNSKTPKNYSLLIDGFVNRFDKNNYIEPVIKEISVASKIGLLTNMYVDMLLALRNRGMFPRVDWNVIIDSSTEKLEKPDPEIFRLAEKRSGFSGQEILFVENSPEHIKAAQSFNWLTFLFNSSDPENSSLELGQYYRSLCRT
jgi:FMN phosphatase YigB (HAD superfamily)